MESEALASGGSPDLKEAFTMRNVLGRVDDEGVWPSDEFRDLSTALFRSCFAAATELLKVCAIALGQKENFFRELHSGENATLRVLHYPDLSPRPDGGQMGAGAHSDYGSITFLFQQDVGGLQILDSNKTWRNCPAVKDAAIVNVGDMLEIWSNGLFPSTRHRVLPRTNTTDRYSIAFFMDPDDQVVVEPLTTCIEDTDTGRFAPVQVREYLKGKIAGSQVRA
jgi:isopenicillin N synthase-like dioxygenase